MKQAQTKGTRENRKSIYSGSSADNLAALKKPEVLAAPVASTKPKTPLSNVANGTIIQFLYLLKNIFFIQQKKNILDISIL